ncbi:MAG: hypothetical protein HAW67_03430 [Endozoicomonadaceae bacterium]|nr:hypothetical protein [Endozoicomonadaceae bacterium]
MCKEQDVDKKGMTFIGVADSYIDNGIEVNRVNGDGVMLLVDNTMPTPVFIEEGVEYEIIIRKVQRS